MDSDDPHAPTADAASSETLADSARALKQSALSRGATVGRYVVLDLLGRGGMGVVYSAYDPELDRRVALKLLRAGAGDDEARGRLLREAQAIARLSHPNVIAVHDVGMAGNDVFIAMEFVDGQTLASWQRDRSPRDILAVYAQAARGLAAAHAAGLVHRDFKPDNAIVGKDGRLRVLDFGLARADRSTGAAADKSLAGVPLSASSSSPRLTGPSAPISGNAIDTPLTRAGALMGTPRYMAPEQLLGETSDARADQFSFCVALYEALYRDRPFAGETLQELRANVVSGRLQEPRERRGPRHVRALLIRGLRARPEERFPSMDALMTALIAPGDRTRTAALLGAALLAIAIAGVATRVVYTREHGICAGASRRLDGVWDAQRRAALHDAFAATHSALAEPAFESTARALDAYAAAWAAQHTSACEATRVHGEQSEELLDLRMDCLDRRRDALRALVDVMSRADAPIVEHATSAAQSLPALAECADANALKAPLRPPATREARLRVASLRGSLAELTALELAGHFAEALPGCRRVVAEARTLGYPPLVAEALYRLALLQSGSDEAREAPGTMSEAIIAAERGHDDALLADAWTQRIGLDNALARYDDARLDAQHAEAWIERTGAGDALRAQLYSSRGNVLSNLGRYDEAFADHRRALDLRIAALGPAHVEVAGSYNNLAVLEYQRGRFAEAEKQARRAVAVYQNAYGETHPDVALALNTLGAALVEEGHLEEALPTFRRVLATYRLVDGEQHPDVAMALSNVGDVLCRLHRCREAVPLLQQAVATWEATLGKTHPNVADGLEALGEADLQLGSFADAVRVLERALVIADGSRGTNPTTPASTRLKLARAVYAEGDRARARNLALAARDAFAAAGAAGDVGRAEAEAWLSQHQDGKPRAPGRARP